MKLPIACLILILWCAGNAVAAETSNTQVPSPVPSERPAESEVQTIPDDFLGLADLRGRVNSEIASLETEERQINETLPKAQSQRERLESIRKSIADLEAKRSKTAAEQARLAELNQRLQFGEQFSTADPQKLSERLGEIAQLLLTKRDLSGRIQKKIASMFSPEQKFKYTMSITFAILIALVIGGFFAVAFKDNSVRQAIFSHETGIQFLTLFSLVIAIILFGITQILEGKELAALLGGLAGYILGRTAPKPS
jgi:hypothetical protein